MSAQRAAVALQKFTMPGFTAVVPVNTVAVRVTAVPAGMVVTGLPPAVIAIAVVVDGGVGWLRIADAVEATQLLAGSSTTTPVSFAQATTRYGVFGQRPEGTATVPVALDVELTAKAGTDRVPRR
jgi:hypothetical protein